jgi:hypothetical protein
MQHSALQQSLLAHLHPALAARVGNPIVGMCNYLKQYCIPKVKIIVSRCRAVCRRYYAACAMHLSGDPKCR